MKLVTLMKLATSSNELRSNLVMKLVTNCSILFVSVQNAKYSHD